jgi:hypothetical protein
VSGLLRVPRKLAREAVAIVVVLLAAAVTGAGLAGRPAKQVVHRVDERLCPFALGVTVTKTVQSRRVGTRVVKVFGPTEITLRNRSTGRTAVLDASGSSSLEPATGSVRFTGHQLWLGTDNHVPFLSTRGTGSKLAPNFVVSGALARRVVDPCALVADTPPSTRPAETPAPWGLPAFALSQIAYARLAPLIGSPSRHDHVHLDLIVNGRKVTLPAGVGQAEPVDVGPGPCPPPPESLTIGDCAPGHYFVARVAASPLQLHTDSGIIHIQTERRERLTLGQFFDVWGVRFDASCVGGYCSGGGKELLVYVDGKRLSRNPRKLVLTNHQQIAVVFGSPGDFDAVPSSYALRWPEGCGGAGERSCFP